MEKQTINKLLALAGSFCLSNGLMLLVAPARFAGLRKVSWLPSGVNRVLDDLAGDRERGRLVGMLASSLGAALLLVALRRTEPAQAAVLTTER